MNIGTFRAFMLPLMAWAGIACAETPENVGPDEPPVNWVDSSHAFATDQAQALTQWMDSFFGNPEDDLDQAESFLRVITETDWDQANGTDFSIRLRGKVQLPRISSRVDLLFSGEEDNEEVDPDERRRLEDSVGVRYNVREGRRSRFDATVGIASGNLRPGVRYRSQDTFGQASNYRFTQRVQYESGEGFYSTSQLELNRMLDEDTQVRWVNRGVWGEKTDGVEWRTRASVRHRLARHTRRPIALSYYAAVRGVTRPDSYVKNYRLGVTVRRRVYRDFLFVEIEPAINFRRPDLEDPRGNYWSLMVRVEIALEKDLRRRKRRADSESEPAPAQPATGPALVGPSMLP